MTFEYIDMTSQESNPSSTLKTCLITGLAFTFLIQSTVMLANSSSPHSEHWLGAKTQTLEEQTGYYINKRYSGSVRAEQNTDLGFEFSGKVKRIMKYMGDDVQQGEVIAELDTDLLHIQKQQLEAKRVETQANLHFIKSKLKRLQALNQKGFASEQTLEEITAQEKVLEATMHHVQAQILAIHTRVDKSSLKAPFSARISQRFIDEGTVVSPAQGIVRLQQKGDKTFLAGIPSDMISVIKEQALRVTIEGKAFDAKLLNTGSELDINTKTVPIRTLLIDSDNLQPGTLGYLSLKQKVEKSGYKIPVTAITEGTKGLWVVYIVKEDADNIGVIEARSIDILHADKDFLYVEGAIESGEKLVSEGLHRFVPGQKVRLLSHHTINS